MYYLIDHNLIIYVGKCYVNFFLFRSTWNPCATYEVYRYPNQLSVFRTLLRNKSSFTSYKLSAWKHSKICEQNTFIRKRFATEHYCFNFGLKSDLHTCRYMAYIFLRFYSAMRLTFPKRRELVEEALILQTSVPKSRKIVAISNFFFKRKKTLIKLQRICCEVASIEEKNYWNALWIYFAAI